MANFRGFIAIDVNCLNSILDFMERLKSIPAKLKLVDPKNIHLTLKFLGNTREEDIPKIEEIIKASVFDIPPFIISIQDVGVFPNKNYINVIWIGTGNKQELVTIANRLNESLQSLGYKKENREFSPHITVARVKRVMERKVLLSLLEEYKGKHFGELRVESVKLKKSVLTPNGPIYSTLKTVPLG